MSAGGTRRWALAGAALGLLGALVAFAPARWLAAGLAQATQQRLLLAEARGSIWSGSAQLVLSAGEGSRDARQLPGRLQWRLGLQGSSLALALRQDCCTNGELKLLLRPGLGRFGLSLPPQGEWLLRWPAELLAGLGTPMNSLEPQGVLTLASPGLDMDWAQGRWSLRGRLDLGLQDISSRVSTLAPLGSYRFSLVAGADGAPQLELITLRGALQLQGQGSLAPRASFRGEASAAPGAEAALANLLNIIGRRQGARSIISVG
ncbi:type II secretion system protein N [Pelomonas sp. CA6]|uniref:type II secretion system protein N n=1 Tax=Pelomonas sp. CA6 TaxID=2907999 RepID=UPI001F4BF306|nr:type II secretion system protein N [Pelomonas sp. CA6]MCH7343264.1 type II secretion system protein N [Pelomonas sp. CA6]